MTARAAFRLALKGIGVLLVGISLSDLLQGVAMSIQTSTWAFTSGAGPRPVGPSQWIMMIAFNLAPLIGGLAQCAFGVYLFMDGRWVLDRAAPVGENRCIGCGYDMRGGVGGKCPECGWGVER